MPTLGKAVQDKPPPVIADTYSSQPCRTAAESPEARTVSYRNHTRLSRGSYLQHSASVWWLLTPELAYLVLTLASRHPAPLHVCSSLVGNPEFVCPCKQSQTGTQTCGFYAAFLPTAQETMPHHDLPSTPFPKELVVPIYFLT